MPDASFPSPYCVELGLGICAANKCPRFSRPESRLESSSVQVIFSVIEPAIAFTAKFKVAIPIVRRFRPTRRHEEINRHRTPECRHPQSVIYGLDVHSPVASVSIGVVVAVVHQGLQFELKRAAGPGQRILDICSICSLLHPNALLEVPICTGECPNRSCSIEPKTLNVPVALRIEGSIGPSIS